MQMSYREASERAAQRVLAFASTRPHFWILYDRMTELAAQEMDRPPDLGDLYERALRERDAETLGRR